MSDKTAVKRQRGGVVEERLPRDLELDIFSDHSTKSF